jgi:hypothetical protein
MDGVISVSFCENNGGGTKIKQKSIRELFQEVSTSTTKKEGDETKELDYYICWLICKVIENGYSAKPMNTFSQYVFPLKKKPK